MDIIPLEGIYRGKVIDHVVEEWGEPIVTRGNIIQIRNLPGFIVLEKGTLAGAVLYEIRDKECEIVVLYSLTESRGVGTKLINSVIETAKSKNCTRVWLITMNDNTRAIRFYQKRGFDLKAVHINAFDITRKLKKLPLRENVLGIDGIPIKHEFEFEIIL
jgi:GNAT superfamily N-acetyltransferase